MFGAASEKTMKTTKLFLLPLILTCSVAARAATLTVTVRAANGLPARDAVVYAVPEGKDIPLVRGAAVMDQKNRMFVPHVLAIQVGTAVSFPNNDDIQHQVYSFSSAKSFQLPLYKGTPGQRITFDKPGVVALGCNIHDNMTAFIVVVDTPYFDKSSASGTAELQDLHTGTYSVHLWYADLGGELLPRSITLSENDHERLNLVIP